MAAQSKIISDAAQIALAQTIKSQHTTLETLKDMFETNKAQLSAYCKDVFIEDIAKDIPEVNGNHELHTTEGTVTVNFKVTGRAPKEINNRPARDVIREKFGDEAMDKMFLTEDDIEILADEATLRTHLAEHPELFTVSLKPLSHQQMLSMLLAYPSLFNVSVVDTKQYATIYPASVKKTPMVAFKAGFIEQLGKVSDAVRKNVRGLMKAILPNVIQVAVKCGNSSKK
jgi:hypothetical protein